MVYGAGAVTTLISPSVVPIRVLTKLAAAGVHTTAEVHRHIQAGTLQTLSGIGPSWEQHILLFYTEQMR